MGVIDAIAEGCFAVARRPVVLAPVVVLDLLFWLGGRVSPAPFTNALAGFFEYAQRQNPGGADTTATDSIATIRSLGAEGDLLTFLALGQHPLLPQLEQARIDRPWGTGVLGTGHWSLVLLLTVVLGLLGLLWLAATLTGLATVVRGEPLSVRALPGAVARCWLRLLGFCAIVAGGVALLLLPLLILSVILAVLNINPALLATLLFLPVLILYIHLALAPEAIAVSEVGPFQAIKLSVRVVRRNFWSMLGLLAATLLVINGFPLGLRLLTGQVAGVPLAIVGNAFVGMGMMAAAMVFYRERLAALETAKSGANTKVEVRGTK